MSIATDNDRSGASVPGSGTSRWETLKHEFMQIWQVLAALLLIYLVFLVLSPPFRSVDTLLSIFGQASILAILACGTTVVLISGGLDLSVGSIFAVVGIVVGILLAEYQLPVAVAVLLGLLTGTLLGAVAVGRLIGIVFDGFDKSIVPPLVVETVMVTILVAAPILLGPG